jgi:hypothetical protein
MAYATVERGKGFSWIVLLPSGRVAGTHYSETAAKNQMRNINRNKAAQTAKGKRWK